MIEIFWRKITRPDYDSDEGSLLFVIGQALRTVRFAPLDDEDHALKANKIVRKCLDKGAIKYADYRIWRALNPLIFTAVVDEKDELIGFFDIFPLKSEAGQKIIEGTLTERSLNIDHLLSQIEIASVSHLHIATVLINPRQRTFSSLVAKEVLILKLRQFLEEHYAPIENHTYTAFAQSRAGQAMLRRCGFSMAVHANKNEQRCPLYVLRPTDTTAALFRFDRADEFFSRAAGLRELDSRIEKIEIQLRQLIAALLNFDPRQLPADVNQKADERIATETKKYATFDASQHKKLPAKLVFCDLRELEHIITNKLLWPKFQLRFVNTAALAIKFEQLATLRNGIRHSRPINDVARKEGEASIIWFEQVLHKQVSTLL